MGSNYPNMIPEAKSVDILTNNILSKHNFDEKVKLPAYVWLLSKCNNQRPFARRGWEFRCLLKAPPHYSWWILNVTHWVIYARHAHANLESMRKLRKAVKSGLR